METLVVPGLPGTDGLDGGLDVASSVLGATYSIQAAWADVPGWSVVVPANSGPCDIEVPSLLANIATGTNPAGTQFMLSVQIVDEATALVANSTIIVYNTTNVNQTPAFQFPLHKSVPNFGVAKTYRVRAQQQKVGTLGSTATIFAADAGFTSPILRAIRR